MNFKSKYNIKFSKPKELVLNYINENSCKSLFDFNKKYIGLTFNNGFDIKFFGSKNSPTIKGNFVTREEEYLLLTISYIYVDVMAYIFIFTFLPLYMLFTKEYAVMFIFVGVGSLFTVIKYFILNESKRRFLKSLRNFDKLCVITEIKD